MRTNELQHQFQKYLDTIEGSSDEVEAAETIQRMLLEDDIPACNQLSCRGMSLPALRLSGDYYDFIYDERNGRYWIFIGDVMGKGIPASLLMVMVRSTARVLTNYSKTPSELVCNLNNFLLKDMTRLRAFSTLFCGMFNVHSGDFLYTSAGHPSPILMRKNEKVAERLEVKGTVIGLLKDRQYRDYSVSLLAGDLLVLCTDGILEAMNTDKNAFGYERLKHSIEVHKDFDLHQLIKHITDDVRRFSKAYRRDDVTLVAVRREEGSTQTC
ncbi:PP2C family protein-serine/threonine phosphatase [Alicyclobacillus fastidiosus]|uniref:PP2C family protein-serine/threonine phosphatase n=1 Tax=Alicyclobacillus fastidiosus TaxID=392011 RepID=A0ABV5AI29_9BACL|nr:PP2C family protein-serine/threonine phosphatase [Alicyclobacillus fastidiosus]WEH10096.1 PP2C family protein-serine/threonine phosphatase [Alicyclobacillus fastidiosus]